MGPSTVAAEVLITLYLFAHVTLELARLDRCQGIGAINASIIRQKIEWDGDVQAKLSSSPYFLAPGIYEYLHLPYQYLKYFHLHLF